LHGLGMVALEDAIAQALPPPTATESAPVEQGALRVAIAGRPNAGKSSLVNRLLGEARQIVDERPGTTVDAVDSLLMWHQQPYVLIDTAGIRRQRSVQRGVESLSVLQAFGAVERSDVVVLLVDSEQGPAEQDAKIAGLAIDRGRALVIALNKIDLLDRAAQRKVEQATRDLLSFAPWVPLKRISARTGHGVGELMDVVAKCSKSHQTRVSTAEVNRFFEEVLGHHPPPTMGGKPVRLFYITQVDIRPPTFVVVANRPELVHFSYRRYLINQLRSRFGFKGTPIRVLYRKKHRDDGERYHSQ
jgi:GTPase